MSLLGIATITAVSAAVGAGVGQWTYRWLLTMDARHLTKRKGTPPPAPTHKAVRKVRK